MLCVGLAVFGGACDTAPIYSEGNRDLALGRVPDRSRWRVTDAVQMRDGQKAIDGSVHTAAVAVEGAEGPSLTIDLGKAGLFNMIALDHGPNEYGFARKVEVHTSQNGRDYTMRYEAIGTRRVSSFMLVSPVVARHVRIKVIAPGPKPWSVAEVHLQ